MGTLHSLRTLFSEKRKPPYEMHELATSTSRERSAVGDMGGSDLSSGGITQRAGSLAEEEEAVASLGERRNHWLTVARRPREEEEEEEAELVDRARRRCCCC